MKALETRSSKKIKLLKEDKMRRSKRIKIMHIIVISILCVTFMSSLSYAATAMIESVYWDRESRVDNDGDGYVRYVKLYVNADVMDGNGPLIVQARLYYRLKNSTFWKELDFIDSFSITGRDSSDKKSFDVTGLLHNEYDFKIDLYHMNEKVPEREPRLEDYKIETAEEDTPPKAKLHAAWFRYAVDMDGDEYVRKANLRWGIDVIGNGTIKVFERIYRRVSSTTGVLDMWDLVYTTAPHDVSGIGNYFGRDFDGLSHNIYDWRIEVVRKEKVCLGTECLYQDAKDDARNINNYYMETADEDTMKGLNVSRTGDGAVTSNPAGINCGSECSASYEHGTSVILTAIPNTGCELTGWSGACSGTSGNTCTVTMNSDRSVSASFTCLQIDYYCDNDDDGYFNLLSDGRCYGSSCLPGGCRTTQGDDCNDRIAAVNPGADDSGCDGVDDDCDGLVDEHYKTMQTECGQGVCYNTGQKTCVEGKEVDSCEVKSTTGDDTDCDGVDDDCDSLVDEHYVTKTTDCGKGICKSSGLLVCENDKEVDTCTPDQPTEKTETTCDDISDNDCDGLTDTADSDCEGNCGSPHWNKPEGSNIQMHLAGNLVIDAINASVCDEVAVFDSGGQLVGTYRVDTEGMYGDLVVYGDSTQTDNTDEGAPAGDKLAVKVWDASTKAEYTKPNVSLLSPASGLPPYVPYQSPLTFNANTFILMDINVSTKGCGQIDLNSGWNFFGWLCDEGYYEGTAPSQSEYAAGSTLTKVNSLEETLSKMGLSKESYLVVVGPDGRVYVPGSPFNTLKSLLPGMAYWIYMGEDGTVNMPGNMLKPSSGLSLTNGWVQTGYWGADGVSPKDAFGCIDGLYDVVADGKGNVYVPNSPFNTLNSIHQVEGYFIHANYVHTTSTVTLKYDCQ